MRVLVCGGRRYGNNIHEEDFLVNTLNAIQKMNPTGIVIICGGATGADTIAAEWAESDIAEAIVFEADWKTHGKRAGPIRNRKMLEEGKPDLVVAFPGGSGTRNMVKLAKAAKVRTLEMGTITGDPAMADPLHGMPPLKTHMYGKVYVERLMSITKGMATPGQKRALYLQVKLEEDEYLINQGKEYDDIMEQINVFDQVAGEKP